jgi:hypothetical protein
MAAKTASTANGKIPLFPSAPSRELAWIPAFAGMTLLG